MRTAIAALCALAPVAPGLAGDACQPTLLGTAPSLTPAHGVMVVGGLAFVSISVGDLRIVDVSDPSAPTPLSAVNANSNFGRVAVVGDVLYIADGQRGVVSVDISDPANPVELDDLDDVPFASGVGVAAVGGLVLLGIDHMPMLVVDASNPADLQVIASVPEVVLANEIQIIGTRAYIADGFAGFVILDISSPATPGVVGQAQTPGAAFGIAVQGSHAYIAEGAPGLSVAEFSDPSSPTIVTTLDFPEFIDNVHVVGSIAYVPADDLYLVDITDPAAPFLTAEVVTPNWAMDCLVSGGGTAYIADHTAGLRIVAAGDCSPCLADLDGDGAATGIDIGVFLQAYAAGGVLADFDGDADTDGIDIGLFLQAYAGGC